MSCSGTSNCTCGCCAGTSVQTPQGESNLPGLSAISYRTGTWATFKESMLARLSSSKYPALSQLKTRDDDDFTIAFLDATAIVLDILTFYQERLANESYLRTATQLRSAVELSRLIAYEPAPGVSASTYLAFALKTTPGQPPNPSTAPVTIPKGTQVQSVPAQGQTALIFETASDILAKADWNALAVLSTKPWIPQTGNTSVYLAGTATQLQPGDAFLIVGDERANQNGMKSERWDIRIVSSVTADGANNRTAVTWTQKLGASGSPPAHCNPQFYAFRQRAALFGYNALNPNLIDQRDNVQTYIASAGVLSGNGDWNFEIGGLAGSSLIDLDSTYPKIIPGGWVALILPDNENANVPPGWICLYHVTSVSTVARSDFGLSAKITRVVVDTPHGLCDYYCHTRKTSALVQSDLLPVAPQPLTYPLYGTQLDLAELRPDLVGTQVITLTGTRQKIAVAPKVTTLQFIPDDITQSHSALNPGDVLTIINPVPLLPTLSTTGQPPDWSSNQISIASLNVTDSSGRTGTLQNVTLNQFVLAPSGQNDQVVTEYAQVSSINPVSGTGMYPHTQILLIDKLANCYDRTTTTINANVGPATHGQSVIEILGSGDASTPNQNFTLKQSPLTFVQAPNQTGRQSTLMVRVNSAAWTEQPSLYQQRSSSQVFDTLNQAGGTTDVIFGDGVEGALLPTGQNNLQATYRIGSGAAGNKIAPGALSTLMDRPLGVSGVTNPESPSGGQDAQCIEEIQTNAPLTVLTLGRAVSITDYQNYAATYAGIAKAYAIWISSGPAQGVFLTVAAVDGTKLSADSSTLANLLGSLQAIGNRLIPITITSYMETIFQFTANLLYDPAYDQTSAQNQAFQAVTNAFNFQSRSFGQSVSADEISAIVQAVPGITAVNVLTLTRRSSSTGGDISSQANLTTSMLTAWQAAAVSPPRLFPDSPNRLCAYLPVPSTDSLPFPAEILVLDPSLTAASCFPGVMS